MKCSSDLPWHVMAETGILDGTKCLVALKEEKWINLLLEGESSWWTQTPWDGICHQKPSRLPTLWVSSGHQWPPHDSYAWGSQTSRCHGCECLCTNPGLRMKTRRPFMQPSTRFYRTSRRMTRSSYSVISMPALAKITSSGKAVAAAVISKASKHQTDIIK